MIKTYEFTMMVKGLSHHLKDSNCAIKRIAFDDMKGSYVDIADYIVLQEERDKLKEELEKLKKKPRRQSGRQAKTNEEKTSEENKE